MKVKRFTGFKNAVGKDKEFMHCRTNDGHTHLTVVQVSWSYHAPGDVRKTCVLPGCSAGPTEPAYRELVASWHPQFSTHLPHRWASVRVRGLRCTELPDWNCMGVRPTKAAKARASSNRLGLAATILAAVKLPTRTGPRGGAGVPVTQHLRVWAGVLATKPC